MQLEINSEMVTAVLLIFFGGLFIFKPEYIGIIIGLFLIIMGVNSLIKLGQRGKHGWRKKA
jgi:multisubunit Na+/H+ antiporter MnhC subunit